jgi:hypothetical protein
MYFDKGAGVVSSIILLLLFSTCNAAAITNTYETSKIYLTIYPDIVQFCSTTLLTQYIKLNFFLSFPHFPFSPQVGIVNFQGLVASAQCVTTAKKDLKALLVGVATVNSAALRPARSQNVLAVKQQSPLQRRQQWKHLYQPAMLM